MNKKHLVLTISCFLLTAGLTFGQTAVFSFNDNVGTPNAGTYNPNDTITLDLSGTATGFTAAGYSLWLEVPTTNGFNAMINITSSTVFQFTDQTQPVYPKSFTDTAGRRNAGYLTDKQGALSGDMGATANAPAENFTGTALLARYTLALSNATPGTYVLFTTALNPKRSGMSDSSFNFFGAAAASYTITVVPEPATWFAGALIGLGLVGFTLLRRRRPQSA